MRGERGVGWLHRKMLLNAIARNADCEQRLLKTPVFARNSSTNVIIFARR